MTSLKKTLFAVTLGAGALAISGLSASAAIICSGPVCWHVTDAYDYPPEARVIIHPDDWRWGPSERFVWREHPGRGYWRGESWVEW
jgi:hypothetical protein